MVLAVGREEAPKKSLIKGSPKKGMKID